MKNKSSIIVEHCINADGLGDRSGTKLAFASGIADSPN
jgi:hypothetical protein